MRLGIALRTAAATCPHLGLVEDPFSRGPHASDEHRCYAHLGRERIDLGHQKQFCLTSAHGTCPFLLVNVRDVKRDWIAEGRTWWRTVSPARQGLRAAQLGQWVGLGVAATARAAAYLAQLVLQAWRSVRPHGAPPIALVAKAVPVVVVAEAEPVVVALEAEPLVVVAKAEPLVVVAEAEPVVVALEAVTTEEETPLTMGREDAREWFWRAKNAETLDDVVKCLQRAHALEPENEMVVFNLEWAKERREAQRQAAKAKPTREAMPSPQPTMYSVHRPSVLVRVAAAVVRLVRTSVGLGVLAVGGMVLVSGLPARLRTELLTAVGGPPTPWLPDVSGMTSLVHVPLGGGYDLGMAFPYAIGFLALFVGFGLLHREPSPSGRH